MSAVETTVPTVKKPTVKKSLKVSKKVESAVENVVNSAESKVHSTESKNTESKVQSKVVGNGEKVKTKSKTTTENIDRILEVLIEHFKLDEKEVRKETRDLLPSTSQYRKKKPKDPNAPKKPLTAFIFFTNAKREEVVNNTNEELKRQAPEGQEPQTIKFKDVMKELGKLWKTMSTADKAPYQAMANENKEQYRKAKEAYAKEHPSEEKKPKRARKTQDPEQDSVKPETKPETTKATKTEAKTEKKPRAKKAVAAAA